MRTERDAFGTGLSRPSMTPQSDDLRRRDEDAEQPHLLFGLWEIPLSQLVRDELADRRHRHDRPPAYLYGSDLIVADHPVDCWNRNAQRLGAVRDGKAVGHYATLLGGHPGFGSILLNKAASSAVE